MNTNEKLDLALLTLTKHRGDIEDCCKPEPLPVMELKYPHTAKDIARFMADKTIEGFYILGEDGQRRCYVSNSCGKTLHAATCPLVLLGICP